MQDKGIYRLPPHINLLYPFVPERHFPEARYLSNAPRFGYQGGGGARFGYPEERTAPPHLTILKQAATGERVSPPLKQAAGILAEALTTLEPFEVRLERLGLFKRKRWVPLPECRQWARGEDFIWIWLCSQDVTESSI